MSKRKDCWMMNNLDKIQRLKEEKNAVILAHYYVDGKVQEIADYIGDSFFLSKKAKELEEQIIVFCGVSSYLVLPVKLSRNYEMTCSPI